MSEHSHRTVSMTGSAVTPHHCDACGLWYDDADLTVFDFLRRARETGLGMIQTWEEDELREMGLSEEELLAMRPPRDPA